MPRVTRLSRMSGVQPMVCRTSSYGCRWRGCSAGDAGAEMVMMEGKPAAGSGTEEERGSTPRLPPPAAGRLEGRVTRRRDLRVAEEDRELHGDADGVAVALGRRELQGARAHDRGGVERRVAAGLGHVG